MQYAPERYYAIPNEDSKWMMRDFTAWQRKNHPEILADKDSAEDRWLIQSDSQTAREASTGNPSYSVLRYNEATGVYEAMDRWAPNRSKRIKELMKKAKDKRASKQGEFNLRGAFNRAKIGN